MSLFRDYSFGYNPYRDGFGYFADERETKKKEELAELRRRANANLANPNRCKKPERERKVRGYTADEAASGHMVLERRQLDKRLKRILLKKKPTAEELGEAEELQSRVDELDEDLKANSKAELTRFVRAYNKSLKGK